MDRLLLAVAVAAVLVGVAFADVARAEEPTSDGMRDVVREEIKSYFKDQKKDFRVYWKDGLNFKSWDGNFKMKIGGRIQADFVFVGNFDENLETATGGTWRSGFEFRRARLYMAGLMHKVVAWKAQYEFAGAELGIKDAWIGLTNLEDCLGCMFPDIKVGHFKEPFCLEELTSSKYITFMERAMSSSTFAPSRNSGVGLSRDFYGERATLALGVFGNSSNVGGGHEWREGYNVTARATFRPWAPCDCKTRFLHLGVAASYRGDPGELRYRARPNVHTGPRLLDTGTFDADSAIHVGFEVAFQYDRIHAAAELLGSMVDAPAVGDPTLWGYYVEVGYMLTGGHRGYKGSSAAWSRTKPCNNFLEKDCRGLGGLMLAVRYDHLDLDDEGVAGGVADDIAIGLNWYLNPNTVVKLNYLYADVENAHGVGSPAGDGSVSGFGARFQIDF